MGKTIYISGANISSGGPLTIFNDALAALSKNSHNKICAIVGDSNLFYKSDNIMFIELPNYKRFILLKFFYEYFYFRRISKKNKSDIWISLNDFTPNVVSKCLYTYFHNASIFFSIEASDLKFSRRIIFQKFYYSIFLRINIKKNKGFIVQQNWIARKIAKKYNLLPKNLIIFKPHNLPDNNSKMEGEEVGSRAAKDRFVLFYPTRAYGYKNVEIICDAIDALEKDISVNSPIELRLTLIEEENAYTAYLKKKYAHLNILWLGKLTSSEVEENYKQASVMVFPSRLETWGLPLSEFSKYRKPIFAVDLEYVHETLVGYPYLSFFKANDVMTLKELLKKAINKETIVYTPTRVSDRNNDFIKIMNWEDLLLP